MFGTPKRSFWIYTVVLPALLLSSVQSYAQLAEKRQTQQSVEGINKTLVQQIGAGQGDEFTPDSSTFLINRDPFRSVRRGRQLFQRKFTVAQGLGPRTGDGNGSIIADPSIGAGIADSCAGCHGRPRGSAGFGGNVFTRPDSRDAPHLFGLGLVEQLADEITTDLRAIRARAISDAKRLRRTVTLTLTSKGIAYGTIAASSTGVVDTSRVQGVDRDLRVRPFFHQGGTISIREFIVGALNAEMGLEAFDPVLATAAAGGWAVTPAGMVLDGSVDRIEAPPVSSAFHDGDGDGVVNEIDPAIVDHLEFYLLNYFKPGRDLEDGFTDHGRLLMSDFGCFSCHIPDLTINTDRRVADVETVYDATRGIFNSLFATAQGRFIEVNDGSGFPTLKQPAGNSFVVRNIFADFKRHDLGPNFWERNFDGTLQKQFMTEPLWGVGNTAPYGHDGRSMNLHHVILRHGGEAQAARNAYAAAPDWAQDRVIMFLETLVLFPPDDTASNLDPGNPADPIFPQRGHGSISLGKLFNNPADPE